MVRIYLFLWFVVGNIGLIKVIVICLNWVLMRGIDFNGIRVILFFGKVCW